MISQCESCGQYFCYASMFKVPIKSWKYQKQKDLNCPFCFIFINRREKKSIQFSRTSLWEKISRSIKSWRRRRRILRGLEIIIRSGGGYREKIIQKRLILNVRTNLLNDENLEINILGGADESFFNIIAEFFSKLDGG